jgi:hypothetical protein
MVPMDRRRVFRRGAGAAALAVAPTAGQAAPEPTPPPAGRHGYGDAVLHVTRRDEATGRTAELGGGRGYWTVLPDGRFVLEVVGQADERAAYLEVPADATPAAFWWALLDAFRLKPYAR